MYICRGAAFRLVGCTKIHFVIGYCVSIELSARREAAPASLILAGWSSDNAFTFRLVPPLYRAVPCACRTLPLSSSSTSLWFSLSSSLFTSSRDASSKEFLLDALFAACVCLFSLSASFIARCAVKGCLCQLCVPLSGAAALIVAAYRLTRLGEKAAN